MYVQCWVISSQVLVLKILMTIKKSGELFPLNMMLSSAFLLLPARSQQQRYPSKQRCLHTWLAWKWGDKITLPENPYSSDPSLTECPHLSLGSLDLRFHPQVLSSFPSLVRKVSPSFHWDVFSWNPSLMYPLLLMSTWDLGISPPQHQWGGSTDESVWTSNITLASVPRAQYSTCHIAIPWWHFWIGPEQDPHSQKQTMARVLSEGLVYSSCLRWLNVNCPQFFWTDRNNSWG